MNEFKLIVAGGRDFNDYALLSHHLFLLSNTTYLTNLISIVSGMARGADALGSRFAKEHNVKLYEAPADWDDLNAPGAVIRTNRQGKSYNANAGFIRNKQMGDFSDALLAFWDGKSKGTAQMIEYMRSLKKPVHIVNY